MITDKQKEDAAKIVRGVYEVQIGKGETYRAPSSRSSNGSGATRRIKGNLMDSIAKLYYGKKKDRTVAANTIRNYLNEKKKVTDKIEIIGSEVRVWDAGGLNFVPYNIEELSLPDFLESLAGKVGIQDSDIVNKYKDKYSDLEKYTRSFDDMLQKGQDDLDSRKERAEQEGGDSFFGGSSKEESSTENEVVNKSSNTQSSTGGQIDENL